MQEQKLHKLYTLKYNNATYLLDISSILRSTGFTFQTHFFQQFINIYLAHHHVHLLVRRLKIKKDHCLNKLSLIN